MMTCATPSVLLRGSLNHPDYTVPKNLVKMIVDLHNILPDQEANDFPDQITNAIKRGADCSTVAAQLLHWMLVDPTHGLINLTHNTDVLVAIRYVSNEIFDSKIKKIAPQDSKAVRLRMQHVETTQQATWLAYMYGINTQHDAQRRVDWMLTAATTDAARDELSSAMHSAAVAWWTYNQSYLAANDTKQFYRTLRDQLLALLAATPAGVLPGDRVKFHHLLRGPQTGSVVEFIKNSQPPRATVLVDHRLSGVFWAVPVKELSPLEPVTA